jgi:hypothetical protein
MTALIDDLRAAQALRAEAAAKLEAADRLLVRKRELAAEKRLAAQTAAAAEMGADVDDVVRCAAERRDAEAIAAAADRALALAQQDQARARAELAGAEAVVREAALAILSDEAHEEAVVILRDRAALAAREQHLAGVVSVAGITRSREVRDVLYDELNTPINELRPRGDLDTPVSALQHKARAASTTEDAREAWSGRFEQLVADAAPDPAPVERAA